LIIDISPFHYAIIDISFHISLLLIFAMPLLFAILFSPLFRHYYLIFAFIDFIDAADAILLSPCQPFIIDAFITLSFIIIDIIDY
jgi:hypothetical protein